MMTSKQHILFWRGISLVVIVSAHSWAVAALLKPKIQSVNPADSGNFGVSIQFRPAAQATAPTPASTQKKSPQPRAQVAPLLSPKAQAPRELVGTRDIPQVKPPQKIETAEKALATLSSTDRHHAQYRPKQNQASGAHQASEISTPLFAAPPSAPQTVGCLSR